MHLMRWQQLFPQIFLCSYPFRVHLQSIFIAGASWKVDQGKTKPTSLTYVRSEEDNPLGLTPLDIYTLYYQLRGSLMIFLLGRIVIKVWDLSPMQRLKFLLPYSYLKCIPFVMVRGKMRYFGVLLVGLVIVLKIGLFKEP